MNNKTSNIQTKNEIQKKINQNLFDQKVIDYVNSFDNCPHLLIKDHANLSSRYSFSQDSPYDYKISDIRYFYSGRGIVIYKTITIDDKNIKISIYEDSNIFMNKSINWVAPSKDIIIKMFSEILEDKSLTNKIARDMLDRYPDENLFNFPNVIKNKFDSLRNFK